MALDIGGTRGALGSDPELGEKTWPDFQNPPEGQLHTQQKPFAGILRNTDCRYEFVPAR